MDCNIAKIGNRMEKIDMRTSKGAIKKNTKSPVNATGYSEQSYKRKDKSAVKTVTKTVEKAFSAENDICRIHKKCGGCQYQGVPYEEQLAKKQATMRKLLGSYGKVLPIIGMENPLYYRNKVHHVFAGDRRGGIISGTYEENSHRVVPVRDCRIEDEACQKIMQTIEHLLVSFKIRPYNEDTGFGLFRHVLIRRGFQSGEILVVLVTASTMFPSKNNFVKALRKEHPEMFHKVVYTGMIDEYFDYCYGHLEYRTVRFETERVEESNFQGNAVVNYTERVVPYTRVIEHKHFAPEEEQEHPKDYSIISREYSTEWKPGIEPYYPVNDEKNGALYQKYQELAKKEETVIFGGRLGQYKYYDMDKVIRAALDAVELEGRGF